MTTSSKRGGARTRARKEHCICKQVYNEKPVKQGSKKMLKDVGMTVAKIRETRAVYMQQHKGFFHRFCALILCSFLPALLCVLPALAYSIKV